MLVDNSRFIHKKTRRSGFFSQIVLREQKNN
ncbi:Uncharacterised protein [Klebsiella pneumoniae]|uniref:Uncharacterized protein n=1 Tax=Klebsiella pneumoniae TaxID=573 RepID=A0A378BML3_KLEPN|nr:Uncharacterised protein [Klebsiella pneumoniae]